METFSSTPTLPYEILAQIVGALDPVGDRHRLLDLLTISSTFWELAARQLYSCLSVDSEQIGQLVAAGKNLSSRSRQSLTFVRRLRISPHLSEAAVESLWAAAVPGEVLFPNARQLIYEDHCVYNSYEWEKRHLRPQRPSDIVLFDDVDMCFTGHSCYPNLFLLPIRTVRTMTIHASSSVSIFQWGFPFAWQVSFRVFDNHFELNDFEEQHVRGRWKRHAVKHLQWTEGDPRPKIEISWLSDKPIPPILEEMEKMEDSYSNWRPSTTGFKFEVYPRNEPLQPHGKCRPCELCGRYTRRRVRLTSQVIPGSLGTRRTAVGRRRVNGICSLVGVVGLAQGPGRL